MTARSTIQQVLCVLLVVCLFAPVFRLEERVADRSRAAEFRTVATGTSTVLLTRAGNGHNHAAYLFTLVAAQSAEPDPVFLGVIAERSASGFCRSCGP